eukprot:TRINITY_DN60170_c0_g1_i1.p1 TRINITY_DN60170_c0_g1~~TRINITY_DN60170_c0_g1_i1.p1  ORF type:complete len:701 (+),score=205.79 TRINITY_DN60170_c0_g1_i1:106-2103(+)
MAVRERKHGSCELNPAAAQAAPAGSLSAGFAAGEGIKEVRFLLLGQTRTGTSLLLSLLDSHPHFKCAQREPLANYNGLGDPIEMLEIAYQELGAQVTTRFPRTRSGSWNFLANEPDTKTVRSGPQSTRLYGVRATPEQLQAVGLRLDVLCDALGIVTVVVVSRRMALETLVSLKIVARADQYGASPQGRDAATDVTAEELQKYINDSRAAWRHVGQAWPAGLTPTFVRYEDLAHDAAFTVERVWRLLGIDPSVDASTGLHRQHPLPVRIKCSNYRQLPITLRTELIDAEQLLRDTLRTSDPTWRRLFVLGGGIIVWHCLDALLKEWVFNLPGFGHSQIYMLTFMQALCVVCAASMDSLFNAKTSKPDGQAAETRMGRSCLIYVALGVLVALSGLMTNTGSKLVNYTTQVVFKSAKLPWVMAWRVMFLRHKKTPAAAEWAWAMVLTCGLMIFTIATGKHGSVAQSDMVRGMICIVIAMSADASRDTLQEAHRELPKQHMLLAMQAFSLPVSGTFLLLSNTYVDAMQYIRAEPRFPALVAGAAFCSYMGQRCVVGVIHEFDSSVANLVTSCRKVVTTLLSFAVYPKPFGMLHALAIGMIASGSHGAYHQSRARGRPDGVLRPQGEWHEGIPDGGYDRGSLTPSWSYVVKVPQPPGMLGRDALGPHKV